MPLYDCIATLWGVVGQAPRVALEGKDDTSALSHPFPLQRKHLSSTLYNLSLAGVENVEQSRASELTNPGNPSLLTTGSLTSTSILPARHALIYTPPSIPLRVA
jgi:hypothetical protein